MARKTETVTLGGQDYIVHPLNIGELEELAGLMERETAGLRVGIAILLVAFRRAEPPLDKEAFMQVEATAKELQAASATVMRLSGMEQIDPVNPPKAPAGQ